MILFLSLEAAFRMLEKECYYMETPPQPDSVGHDVQTAVGTEVEAKAHEILEDPFASKDVRKAARKVKYASIPALVEASRHAATRWAWAKAEAQGEEVPDSTSKAEYWQVMTWEDYLGKMSKKRRRR
jgi:hypothetical protein